MEGQTNLSNGRSKRPSDRSCHPEALPPPPHAKWNAGADRHVKSLCDMEKSFSRRRRNDNVAMLTKLARTSADASTFVYTNPSGHHWVQWGLVKVISYLYSVLRTSIHIRKTLLILSSTSKLHPIISSWTCRKSSRQLPTYSN